MISKMIPIIKDLIISQNYKIDLILPNLFLQKFEKSLIPMASWQIINILKTFLFHLEAVLTIDYINNKIDSGQVLYVEYIITLLCTLLSCVRMAEHTVSDIVVDKFTKIMEDIKVILEKLGALLLKMEHVSLI